jgi:hypothetical protein
VLPSDQTGELLVPNEVWAQTQAMAAATAAHSSFLQLQKYHPPEWASALKMVVSEPKKLLPTAAAAAVAAPAGALSALPAPNTVLLAAAAVRCITKVLPCFHMR